jgi:pyridoxine 5-phosphate synthase
VHPRADQRHIRPGDVRDLKAVLTAEFNIEGDPRPDLLDLVVEVRPTQCTLVPVTPGEVTSDHGWDLGRNAGPLARAVERLKAQDIRVSLFMDPEPGPMAKAAALGADRVELYTAPYACAGTPHDIAREFERLRCAHDAALEAGLGVNAGHDLDLCNLPRLQGLPGLLEVSIGHALISHALYVGLDRAVRDFRQACGQPVSR